MTLKSKLSSTTPVLFRDAFPDHVVVQVSDRVVDFSLNDIQHVFDDRQRQYLTDVWGVSPEQIINVRQVHGDQVRRVSRIDHTLQEADALITDLTDVAIAIRTADCVPIFLYDPGSESIGLVHAGWRGTREGIVTKTIDAMVEAYGSDVGQIRVMLGPHIRRDQYEVSKDFVEYFPGATVVTEGRVYLDLARANSQQLLARGVQAEKIFDCGICTFADMRYDSYRRQGTEAGRMLSLMMIKDSTCMP